MFFLGAAGCGPAATLPCDGGAACQPPCDGAAACRAASVTGDRDRALAIVSRALPLPERAETVGLADAIAIAAQRAGPTETGAGLTLIAARLRARLFRTDSVPSDAREALELYTMAARTLGATEAGCEVDLERALFAGDFAQDAAVTYRELYLALRRHEPAPRASVPDHLPPPPAAPPQASSADAATPSAPAPPPPASASRPAARALSGCREELERALADAVAYRPAGAAMQALVREGDTAAIASLAGGGIGGGTGATVALDPAPSASAAAKSADLVVSPEEATVGKDAAKVLAVEPYSGEDAARVVLRMSAPATFSVGAVGVSEAGNNIRVFVDVARATSRGIGHEIQVGGLLKRVRLGAHSGGTRVVLDLGAKVSHRVFYLPDPFRIVIDVTSRLTASAERPKDSGPREIRRIALDPGHGGNDSGAIGPTGLAEKDVTLDIAHRAAPLLAHELQVETLLTRDTDGYVPLDLRAARANAFHADLFISIHCNASENTSARGVQTFVLDEARDPDGLAARVAARENAQRGGGSEIGPLLAHLRVGESTQRSRHVAELLQRATLGSLLPRYPDTRDQGVKTAGFFVLVGADMPAVLFETAFISNSEEERRLATADYRQKFADAIANAVRAFKAGK